MMLLFRGTPPCPVSPLEGPIGSFVRPHFDLFCGPIMLLYPLAIPETKSRGTPLSASV